MLVGVCSSAFVYFFDYESVARWRSCTIDRSIESVANWYMDPRNQSYTLNLMEEEKDDDEDDDADDGEDDDEDDDIC